MSFCHFAPLTYTHLPIGLKTASIVATFEGLLNMSRDGTTNDRILEFERAAVAIASGPLGSLYKFTDYSFARDKSNISADDVVKITNFSVSKIFGRPHES
ncbi:hypothetical protein C7W93_06675 [Glaciimonas sp. PCH181]|nr:hypothetical protein C7W93_06675 [Glaciimonas sp. PCH181]